MQRHPISFLKLNLVVAFCAALLPYAAQSQTTDDQKIILDLEKQKNYAISLHDEKTLSDLLDESYTGVTASGKTVNKSEQLTIYKSTNPYITYTAENISVTVNESIAVVTGTLVGKTKTGSVIGQTRYLYVYLKSNGNWRIKTSQETIVIKE